MSMASTTNGQNGDHQVDGKKKEEDNTVKQALILLGYVGAIYACYLYYGILQEDIQHGHYGEDKKDRFSYSWFLVFIQCIVNGLFALLLCSITPQPEDRVPKWQYFKISFSYIFAMFSSNASLVYVSYPTQALAKCCKLIPVMLSRIVINRVTYKPREYANVLLITAGISMFMMMGKSKLADSSSTSLMGIFFLGVSLALDAYTGPAQEKAVAKYGISSNQMQLWLNVFAVLIVAVALVVTGEGIEATLFCIKYPHVLNKIFLFALCSAVGQAVILSAVFRFNSLVVTTITTTRKFFTVLFSVLLFGHQLNIYQWLGVVMVFTSLFFDMYWKNQSGSSRHGHTTRHTTNSQQTNHSNTNGDSRPHNN